MNRSIIIDGFNDSNNDKNFEGLGDLGKIKLQNGIPCIINKSKNEVISIPGITGSKKHKTNHTDKNLILEIANFDADKVAMGSFKLNYRSPSSKFYSGGIEKRISKIALIKYYKHIKKAGSIKKVFTSGSLSDSEISFNVSLEWLYSKISSELSEDKKTLIDNEIKSFGELRDGVFKPNSHYNIIKNKYDLLQEIIRLIGFDGIKDRSLEAPILNKDTKSKNLIDSILKIKKYIVSLGFNEIFTRPFVQKSWLLDLDNSTKLINPNNETKPYLSDNLENRLLDSYNNNLNFGEKNLNLFEVSPVFLNKEGNTVEVDSATLLFETDDEYKASSIANKLYQFLYSNKCTDFDSNDNKLGKSVLFNEKLKLTQISNKTLKNHSIPLTKSIWSISFKIDENIQISKYKKYSDENQFSYIKRVINFDIDNESINASQIENKFIDTELFDVGIDFVDIYKGDGKTTLSVEVTFNNSSRNITNQEVDDYLSKI